MTLQALMSDEILMEGLVLKGGNALQLAYDITNRGSIDIDFSMDHEFSPKDFERLKKIFSDLLNEVFNLNGILVYDVRFIERPKSGSIREWKGYYLEFKIIEKEKYDKLSGEIDAVRRESIKINESTQSTKFTVDISSYEYTVGATKKEIDGLILNVYTPEMILVEKVRALCQTMEDYKKVVTSARSKKRARDVYDIWKITQFFKNLELSNDLFVNIFRAKKVPLEFVSRLEELRELNRSDWDVVRQTISSGEELLDYDFYFDHLLDLVKPFTIPLDNTNSTDPNTL